MDFVTATDTPAVLVIANRAVVYGTVVRWLIHDLRNPAQTLSLVTELIGDPAAGLDPDLNTALRESTQQLTACVETLDRTLRLVPPPVQPGPLALSDVINFLSRMLQSYRSATRLELSAAAVESMPAVAGTEDSLEHALLNLVMNAIEAIGDQDAGRITVSADVVDGQVELIVDDNGPGVAQEMLDRLFEPYTSTKPPSAYPSGLGLAVARYLMQDIGGTVAYIPKPAPGAKFVIRLRPWTTVPHRGEE